MSLAKTCSSISFAKQLRRRSSFIAYPLFASLSLHLVPFFHAQTPVFFHIREEFSPNVRMILSYLSTIVFLTSLRLSFAILPCRKIRLPFCSCPKISPLFVKRITIFACKHSSYGIFYETIWLRLYVKVLFLE